MQNVMHFMGFIFKLSNVEYVLMKFIKLELDVCKK